MLCYRYVSAGEIFRRFAEMKGINIKEFNAILDSDPYLSESLDNEIVVEAETGNVVIDGRIAAWVTREHAALKICLWAPLDVRVRRIAKRNGMTYDQAMDETRMRETQEKNTFLKRNDIDVDGLSVYEIIVNTERFDMDEVLKIVNIAFDCMKSR